MYPELKGKVAIVTGAGGSLGSAVARRFHEEGARLVLLDRSEDSLNRTVQECGVSDILTGLIDLAQKSEIDNFLNRALAQFNALDILANIAGGFAFSGPVYQMDPNQLDLMYSINFKTTALLSGSVAARMVERKTPGRIINIGARPALHGVAGLSSYSASKAAVLRLTESMAAELREEGITVNAVLPSTIDTPANRQAMASEDFTKWVTPESLAGVIAFLASDQARDITGAAIPVYGKA